MENSSVYGLIFLFKHEENVESDTASSTLGTTVTDEDIIKRIFFAHQIVLNSCATHALLSILMNCDEIDLGEVMTEFKRETFGMSPEAKGNAVGKSATLAWAHNKHATPSARLQFDLNMSTSGRGNSRKKGYHWRVEAQFHFISYVPIDGRLYELDGLQSRPVDHGEIPPGTRWTKCCQSILQERIDVVNSTLGADEIRYNLMAVVPSKLDQLQRSLDTLKKNKQILFYGLEKLLKATDPELMKVASQLVGPNSHSVRFTIAENDKDGAEKDSYNNLDSSQFRVYTAALFDAAKKLNWLQDPTSRIAPFTVVTSDGQRTPMDLRVSIGAIHCSALNGPIKNVEVVAVTKERNLSLSAVFGRDDADSPKWMSNKFSLVVKVEAMGMGFRLLDPLGLVTCMQHLDDKIGEVGRCLSEEMAKRDQRRMLNYDVSSRTVTTLVEQNTAQQKNDKPNGKRAKSRSGRAKRKKRFL